MTERVEPVAALSFAAVATAWSGYRASRRNGEAQDLARGERNAVS